MDHGVCPKWPICRIGRRSEEVPDMRAVSGQGRAPVRPVSHRAEVGLYGKGTGKAWRFLRKGVP